MDLGAGVAGAVELGDSVFEVVKGFAASEVLPVVGERDVLLGSPGFGRVAGEAEFVVLGVGVVAW